MYKFEKASGQIIASDTQKSVAALDEAVMTAAHLCASIVEVSKASRLPVGAPQPALADVGESLSKLIAGRADIARATRRMLAMQRASNLEKMAFGCPDEIGLLTNQVDTGAAVCEAE